MSFSFHFSGDDIEPDANEESTNATQLAQASNEPPTTHSLIPPQKHTLQSLLKEIPSQISYNYLTIPQQSQPVPSITTQYNASPTQSSPNHDILRIARRAIFDINAQLMAEADPTDTDTNALVQGLNTGDLSTGVYEGGFKTWECAVDLASLIARSVDGILGTGDQRVRVIELGAGSGVPALVVLGEVLRRAGKGERLRQGGGNGRGNAKVRVTFCDYNYDVLRLCTAVNVLLACALNSDALEANGAQAKADLELEDIDPETVQRCLQRLDDGGVEVDLISGAWGEDFVKLLDIRSEPEKLLLLASETIYSPEALGVFTRTVLEIVRSNLRANGGVSATVWVAAKKVYFGVGGGVAEFEQEVQRQGGTTRRILDLGGSETGVGRMVLEVGI